MNPRNGQSASPTAGKPGLTGQAAVGMCCAFFLLILSIPLMFVFMYAWFPKIVCILVLIILFAGLTPILVRRGHTVKSADSSGPLLSVILTVSLLMAGAAGLHNYYAHVQPMLSLKFMRTYKNVYPQQPGLAFFDAAYVEFAGSTSVDVSKAISFKSLSIGFYTFCAAPIVDAQNTGKVEFWAVGVDCCGNAGSFECDSVAESGVQKGWVMRTPMEDDILYKRLGKYLAPPEMRKDLFMQAALKAEGLHEITSGDEPIMVRWTSKSKDELVSEETWSIVMEVSFQFVSAGLAAIALTALYQRFTSIHYLHDRLRFDPDEPEIHRIQHHQTARILEFFQTVSTLHRVPPPPIKYEDVCLMSVVLPYVVLISCLLLWSFAYCSRFGNWIMTPFLMLLSVFIAVLLMTPNRCMQGGLILMITVVGTYIGCFNWDNNMLHYCSVESHRSYSNVFADADSLEYLDAGKFHFQESARLMKEWSAGFKHGGNTFCVAPVVSDGSCSEQANNTASSEQTGDGQDAADDASEETSGDASAEAVSLLESKAKRSRKRFRFVPEGSSSLALLGDSFDNSRHSGSGTTGSRKPSVCNGVPGVPSRVDFWAVGKNCCAPSGDFWCSDVEDKSAKSAILVYAFTGDKMDKKDPWNYYNRAVRKATESFELPFPDNPVLLKWGKDVEELQNQRLSKAIGVVVLTSIAGMLAIMALAMLTYCFARQQRRSQKQDRQRAETGG